MPLTPPGSCVPRELGGRLSSVASSAPTPLRSQIRLQILVEGPLREMPWAAAVCVVPATELNVPHALVGEAHHVYLLRAAAADRHGGTGSRRPRASSVVRTTAARRAARRSRAAGRWSLDSHAKDLEHLRPLPRPACGKGRRLRGGRMLLESEQQGARHKRRNRCHGTDNRAPSCGWHAHPRPLRLSLHSFLPSFPKKREREGARDFAPTCFQTDQAARGAAVGGRRPVDAPGCGPS